MVLTLLKEQPELRLAGAFKVRFSGHNQRPDLPPDNTSFRVKMQDVGRAKQGDGIIGTTDLTFSEYRKRAAAAQADVREAVGGGSIEEYFYGLLDSCQTTETLYLSDATYEPPSHSAVSSAMRRLATGDHSPLSVVGHEITGVMTPLSYFGYPLSYFGYHVEDEFMYSININLDGEPKHWNVVRTVDAERLKRALRSFLPLIFRDEPAVLHRLALLYSPLALQAAGVPVRRIIQQPGEVVVTTPRGYHAGFNAGYNHAMACNFAVPSWIEYGMCAFSAYRRLSRPSIFSTPRLLAALAASPPTSWSVDQLRLLHRQLAALHQEEEAVRQELIASGAAVTEVEGDAIALADDRLCTRCKRPLTFSWCARSLPVATPSIGNGPASVGSETSSDGDSSRATSSSGGAELSAVSTTCSSSSSAQESAVSATTQLRESDGEGCPTAHLLCLLCAASASSSKGGCGSAVYTVYLAPSALGMAALEHAIEEKTRT